MQVRMEKAEALSPQQLSDFLNGSAEVRFVGQKREEAYGWIERTLVAQEYHRQRKKQRGRIRAYLAKVTGLSLAQITRLIRQYIESGVVKAKASRRRRFPRRYTEGDIRLLAEVDRAHERLSGPATRRILQREHEEFGRKEFQRLAKLSVSHLYNLRRRTTYRKHAAVWEPTRPTAVSIAERRKPNPQGRPGYLRIDTVHQGDWDGNKGVFHINSVDAVTQWEIVGAAPKISEQFLRPVLEKMLKQYPFPILGIHADNGSEYINHMVAKLLEKMLIEFTKSRANRSQDNALVEGKNGAIIRKHMGYGYIASEHAEELQKFYVEHLNVYLNYHRPCGFATVSLDVRGKRQRRYKAEDYATPYEKLKSLPEADQYLKAGISFQELDALAGRMSDTDCAKKLGAAKQRLLRRCKSESPLPPRFL
jgi:transposase InsO family protein